MATRPRPSPGASSAGKAAPSLLMGEGRACPERSRGDGGDTSPPQYPAEDAGSVEQPANLAQFDALLQRYPVFLRGQKGRSENTVRVYLADLATFRAYLVREGLGVADMDRRRLRAYLAWLATEARETHSTPSGRSRKEGYARVSIARKLVVLRSFYRFLVQVGLFPSSPIPTGRSFQVKVGKGLPTFLGKQEVLRLLDAPPDSTPLGLRDCAILEVLYGCGVRLAEIQGLNLEDISFPRREILVRGKGSKERWVLFGQPAEAALMRYINDGRSHLLASPTPALFLNRYGQRLSRRSIEELVRRYAAQAGTRDGVHPHTLRHTFATHMLEGEADLRAIQQLLGHASPTTTQIYTHVTRQEARAAYLAHHPLAGKKGESASD